MGHSILLSRSALNKSPRDLQVRGASSTPRIWGEGCNPNSKSALSCHSGLLECDARRTDATWPCVCDIVGAQDAHWLTKERPHTPPGAQTPWRIPALLSGNGTLVQHINPLKTIPLQPPRPGLASLGNCPRDETPGSRGECMFVQEPPRIRKTKAEPREKPRPSALVTD